jgi:uncharacterized membrane protein
MNTDVRHPTGSSPSERTPVAPVQDPHSVETVDPGHERTAGVLLGAALVTMGLMAGLFYSYSISVMLGLAKTDDRTFILVMQRINQAIQNVAFGPVFAGALLFSTAAAVAEQRLGARAVVRWVVASLFLYAAALAVTFGVNIPLNEKLRLAGDVDQIPDLAALRDQFEGPWVAGNAVRTVVATAALGCLGKAIALHGHESGRRGASSPGR